MKRLTTRQQYGMPPLAPPFSLLLTGVVALLMTLLLGCNRSSPAEPEPQSGSESYLSSPGRWELEPSASRERLELSGDGRVIYERGGSKKSGHYRIRKSILEIYIEERGEIDLSPRGTFLVDQTDGEEWSGSWQGGFRILRRID